MSRIPALLFIASLAFTAETVPLAASAALPTYVSRSSAPHSLYIDLTGGLILGVDPGPAASAPGTPDPIATSSDGGQGTSAPAVAAAMQPAVTAVAGPAPISRLNLGFTATSIVEYEGNATRTITLSVSRAVGAVGAATVRYDTSNLGATAGSDYVAVVNGTISWASGDPVTKDILITVNGDTDEEPDESFLVTLSAPTGDALSANTMVMIALRNDDGASAALAASSAASIQPNGTGDSGACGAGAITGLLLGIGGLGLVRRRRR